MKKYDKHMKYRDTGNAKSQDFDRRLEVLKRACTQSGRTGCASPLFLARRP